MATTFASDEWIDAFYGELRADERVRDEGTTWVYGPLLLVIEAEEDKQFAEPAAIAIDLLEGETRDVRRADPRATNAFPFVIGGDYSRWKLVSQGQLDIVDAVLGGRLRCKGDLPTIARHRSLFATFAACAARVDTAFPDDIAAAAANQAAPAGAR